MERERMKKIVLLGGGGHCKSIVDVLKRGKYFDEIVITDCEKYIGSEILGVKIVGTDDCLKELKERGFQYAFISVGSIENTSLRHALYCKAKKYDFNVVNIIDNSAVVSTEIKIGEGIYIAKGAIVNAGTIIEDMAIINTAAVLEHESYIGKYSHISVGSVLCGNVRVGEDCFVGANTTVIQGVSIGNGCVVGAGSVILGNMKENTKTCGVYKDHLL